MTATYKELLAQLKALEAQTEEARKRELADTVAKVRELIDQYGLTAEDVFPQLVRRVALLALPWLPSTVTQQPAQHGPDAARLRSGLQVRTKRSSPSPLEMVASDKLSQSPDWLFCCLHHALGGMP